MKHLSAFILVLLFLCAALTTIEGKGTCPPRGWDSYDSQPIWAGRIPTEQSTLQQAQALSMYSKAGGDWKYIIMDEGWSDVRFANESYYWSMDAYGRPTPLVENFPSSAGNKGLRHLADKLESMGFELGVWHIKGIPKAAVDNKLPVFGTNCTADQLITTKKLTCGWHNDVYDVSILDSNGCGQAYYDSLIDLWAGPDYKIRYFKIDCISGSDLRSTEIMAYSNAIQKAERKYNVTLVLSISPGFLENKTVAQPLFNTSVNLFRVTDDLWDCWSPELQTLSAACLVSNVVSTVWTLVYFQSFLDQRNAFGKYFSPDPDMIPVSKIDLWYPHFSILTGKQLNFVWGMWSITKSPIILGGNLTQISDATNELPQLNNLLTNRDLRDMHCNGKNPRVVNYRNITKIPNSKYYTGEVVWQLSSDNATSVWLGFFPFDPFDNHDINTPVTSLPMTWSEIGLTCQRSIVTSYDVLRRQPGPSFNVTQISFTMTTNLNDATIWLLQC